ncbi:MAG: metallo-beta-lactamase family protein, partial [Arcobacteraceae bacterium]
DQKGILEWLEGIQNLHCVYLIHGEEQPMRTLKEKIKTTLNHTVHIVKMRERIHL